MSITAKERYEVLSRLERAGFSCTDANKLRRIALTLHRWNELECGDGRGHIERNEETGVPFYYNDNARYIEANDPRRAHVIPDREKGAQKRLAALLKAYPGWIAYEQSDPRGASLYLLPPNSIKEGEQVDSFYSSRGIAVY